MDPAAKAARSARAARAAKMIPFIVGCALFMQMLDSTVVATALPAMAASLGSTPVRLNVAITSYLLAVAVFVPICGWAADRYGARRVFVAAIALFTLSSVACALVQNLPQLVAARVVQGMAGAMMVPVGRIILLRTVPKHELLRAMAFLSMPALLGPVLGPPLGGFIVTYLSWHWIFLMNIPFGILGVMLVLRYVDEIRDLTTPPLDMIGFVLTAVGVASLQTGLESLGYGLMALWKTLGLLAIGAGSLVLYTRRARRVPYPIIDLSLLSTRTFAISVMGGNLCRFVVGAMPFLLSVLLQVGFGFSPLQAGLITFASAAGALLMKTVATPIVKRFGFRRVLITNALLTGVSVIACAAFSADTPAWVMIVILLTGGFFRSLQFTAINTLTYADLDHKAMSRATSFASMAQQMGISLGVAVAAITLHTGMELRGADTLAVSDVTAAFVVIGLLCIASILSFRRLPMKAGALLNK